jgi:uncharacterized membrane protein YcaP (DUF421 family)
MAALVLMGLHWLVAWATFKSSFLGSILKGKSLLLFCDGKPILKNLKKVQITEKDLLEALYLIYILVFFNNDYWKRKY